MICVSVVGTVGYQCQRYCWQEERESARDKCVSISVTIIRGDGG